MNELELRNLLMKVLAKYTKNKDALTDPKDELELREDLKIKSARFADVVLDLEFELDVEIEPDDMDEMYTVGESLAILKKYVTLS